MTLFSKAPLICYTGCGKGKTTAALGLAVRCLGQGGSVKLYEFIKSPRNAGELSLLKQLGVPVRTYGSGFIFPKDITESLRIAVKQQWQDTIGEIVAGEFDMVVLDEVNHLLHLALIDTEQFLRDIGDRPAHTCIVCTGRNAPQKLMDRADICTVMDEVSHSFKELGTLKGIDY